MASTHVDANHDTCNIQTMARGVAVYGEQLRELLPHDAISRVWVLNTDQLFFFFFFDLMLVWDNIAPLRTGDLDFDGDCLSVESR